MSESYPWKVIDPKDFIRVESAQSLTLKNVHVLTRLYQPLIGGAAFSLYLALFSSLGFEARTTSMTISEVLTKIDFGIPDFYHARLKLEGIGLLRVFRSNDEPRDYYYELVSPLSAEDFFNDSLLRTLLLEKIGDRLFQNELEDLLPEPNDKSTYEETTRSFLDVYHMDIQNSNVLDNAYFTPVESEKRPKLAETIENIDSFDYSFFKAGLDKHFIKKDSLTKEIKELILTFHTVYGIDELTMQQLILQSADVESGVVNKNRFTSNVQRNFQNKANLKAPDEMMQTVEVDKGDFSDDELRIIRNAKEKAPANYLRSIKEQKGGFVTTNEQWVLKELVEQSPLTKEVINILMNYILVGRENPTLEKNYTMKIANDWAQSGVKSAEDAIRKIKEIYQQPNNRAAQQRPTYQRRSYQKPKAQGKLPDWAKEENKKQSTADEKVSGDRAESFQERLERLRKRREEMGDN